MPLCFSFLLAKLYAAAVVITICEPWCFIKTKQGIVCLLSRKKTRYSKTCNNRTCLTTKKSPAHVLIVCIRISSSRCNIDVIDDNVGEDRS